MLTLGAAAQASTVIFEEDFADDLASNMGTALNFAGFEQFSTTGGTVDLIASGAFGITCGPSGACVDLDGSTGQSGFFSSVVLNFTAGVT